MSSIANNREKLAVLYFLLQNRSSLNFKCQTYSKGLEMKADGFHSQLEILPCGSHISPYENTADAQNNMRGSQPEAKPI